ncbi:hypothetical protein PRNP1_014353 [Phytophthora ramorum]
MGGGLQPPADEDDADPEADTGRVVMLLKLRLLLVLALLPVRVRDCESTPSDAKKSSAPPALGFWRRRVPALTGLARVEPPAAGAAEEKKPRPPSIVVSGAEALDAVLPLRE